LEVSCVLQQSFTLGLFSFVINVLIVSWNRLVYRDYFD
jgi:uncharacterized membrane protein YvlD (DUF360 family)